MDSGNGVAPITLTANKPIAQAELNFAPATTHGLKVGHHSGLAFGMLAAAQAGVLARLHQNALGCHSGIPINAGHHAIRLILEPLVQRIILGADDGDNGQVVLACELKVTLVAARNRHNGARAVIGHHVIGNPNGQLFAVDGVFHVATGKRAVLLVVALRTLDRCHFLGCFHQIHDGLFVFRARYQVFQALILGRQHEEARTAQRIGTRGEHGNQIVVGGLGGYIAIFVAQREHNLGTFRAANPVRLLLLYALGPTGKFIQVIQQFLSVIGNLEVPLRKVLLLHLGIAAPALAFDNLLVCQNGLAARAPVHRRITTLHQALLPELQENILAPAVILGVACHNGAIPVVGKAHALKAGLLRVDVRICPDGRVAVMLDGGVFRR